MKLLKTSMYFSLLFFILFIPSIALAERAQTYDVNSTVLNVRSEPASNAEIVGVLTKGNQLKGFKEKYGWVQTYYKGREAWVAKHHLIALTTQNHNESDSSGSNQESVTIAASSINIRSGPGTNHSVIGSAFLGENYQVVNAQEDWYQISYNGGSSGWIASWLTDKGSRPQSSEAENPISETPIKQEVDNRSLSGYTIVLDPGHGGHDSGAIGLNGVYEKNLTATTADYIAEQLRHAGANVILTRSGDYFISLEERAQISNSYHTDAFISLHYNAFPIVSAQGISTYYASRTGRELGATVQSALSSSTSLSNRGILQEDFSVLRNTNTPAILVELGFITNPYDLSIIQGSNHQNAVAVAITNGLIHYFGD